MDNIIFLKTTTRHAVASNVVDSKRITLQKSSTV